MNSSTDWESMDWFLNAEKEFEKENFRLSLQYINGAIELEPKSGPFFGFRAGVHLELKEYHLAYLDAKLAREFGFESHVNQFVLGASLEQLDYPKEALIEINQGLKMLPKSDVTQDYFKYFLVRAKALKHLDSLDLAKKNANWSLVLSPGNPLVLKLQRDLLEQQDSLGKSLKKQTEIMSIEGETEANNWSLGKLLYLNGKVEEGCKLFEDLTLKGFEINQIGAKTCNDRVLKVAKKKYERCGFVGLRDAEVSWMKQMRNYCFCKKVDYGY